MRGFRFGLACALFVTIAGNAQAGIYCSLDRLPYPVPQSFDANNNKLADVRAVNNTDKNGQATKELYEAHVAALKTKEKENGLTLDERIELTGLYLRLQRFGDVKDALKNADQTHYLVLAHLAAAHFGLSESSPNLDERKLWLSKAVDYQEKALAAWPAVSLRWNLAQLTWYRRAERYYLELLRLRLQQAKAGKTVEDNVDALFPRLSLETAGQAYEVGGPPAKHVERLQDDVAADALPLIVQLVWWQPFDNRLYWLYGEVLNYRGDFVSAYKVFDQLGNPLTSTRKYRVRKFMEHYRAFEASWPLWQRRHKIGFIGDLVLRPRDWENVVGALAALQIAEKLDDPKERDGIITALVPVTSLPPEAPVAPPPVPSTGTWLPDWRTVVVSFAAGMVVMVLLQLQWKEWSRRRALALEARRQLTS